MKAYLIGALVGAIIGYITNWLAIKMLFSPHEEKRLLGIKIPFTPGLIPREKSRIAENVGETVGEQLLTPEVISKSLNNPVLKDKLKNEINIKVRGFISSEKTLEEELANFDKKMYEKQKIKIKDRLIKMVIKYITTDNFIKSITAMILEKLNEEIMKKPVLLHELVKSGTLRNIIMNFINEEKNKKYIKENIKDIILMEAEKLSNSDKTMEEVIPKQLIEMVEFIVHKEKDFIANELVETLRNGAFSEKIKSIIVSSIPSMVSMFVNVNSIYNKIIDVLATYLIEEEMKQYLCETIISFLHNGTKISAKEALNGITEKQFEDISSGIMELINENVLNEEEMLKYIGLLEEYILNIESYDSILRVINKDYKILIEKFVVYEIEKFINTETLEKNIEKIINNSTEEVLQTPIKDMLNDIDHEDISESIFIVLEKYYDGFVENNSAKVIEAINIPKIVEEQINSFEVQYVEKIILSIAKKELRAITWLGAILGALLGVLSPLLATLYM